MTFQCSLWVLVQQNNSYLNMIPLDSISEFIRFYLYESVICISCLRKLLFFSLSYFLQTVLACHFICKDLHTLAIPGRVLVSFTFLQVFSFTSVFHINAFYILDDKTNLERHLKLYTVQTIYSTVKNYSKFMTSVKMKKTYRTIKSLA